MKTLHYHVFFGAGTFGIIAVEQDFPVTEGDGGATPEEAIEKYVESGRKKIDEQAAFLRRAYCRAPAPSEEGVPAVGG